MSDTDQKLIVFEQSMSDLVDCLRFNVIRMAAIHDEPWAPLRPGKEITYDPTGMWVLPNSRTGISLAASMKQLRKVFGKGRKNWLFAVDRHRALPEGLEFDKEDVDHWIIIVNRRMQKDELLLKLIALAREWRALGRFQRDE